MAEPHLDDDALSELLDAATDPLDPELGPARAHLAACDTCSRRFATFDGARRVAATPVAPLDDETLDRLVSTAIAAFEPEAVGSVVSLDRGRRRLRAPAPAWLAAVAAALLLLLAVPALLDRGDDGQLAGMDRESSAAFEAGDDAGSAVGEAAPMSDATAESSDATAGATSAVQASPAAGGGVRTATSDPLGPIDDTDELVRRLVAALSTDEDRYAGDDVACAQVARDVGGNRLGSLVYSSDLTWRGERAVVLVFMLTEPSRDGSRQAYVMTTTACSVLAEPRF